MLILEGHARNRAVSCVNFSPDGTKLVSSAIGDCVRLWDFPSGEGRLYRTALMAAAVAFSPDGGEVACRHSRGLVLWPLANGYRWSVRLGLSGDNPVVFSPDGRFLATGGAAKILWNRQTGQGVPLKFQAEFAAGVAFSPDGRTLASAHGLHSRGGNWRSKIRLTDLSSKKTLRTIRDHEVTASALAYSPNGRLLAAACGHSLLVWDVAGGEPVTQIRLNRLNFQAVSFTPDSRFLGAAHNDDKARFWDTTTWRQHVAFDWDIGPLVSLDIARDGLRAAAGSKRGKIVVWDIDF